MAEQDTFEKETRQNSRSDFLLVPQMCRIFFSPSVSSFSLSFARALSLSLPCPPPPPPHTLAHIAAANEPLFEFALDRLVQHLCVHGVAGEREGGREYKRV